MFYVGNAAAKRVGYGEERLRKQVHQKVQIQCTGLKIEPMPLHASKVTYEPQLSPQTAWVPEDMRPAVVTGAAAAALPPLLRVAER